MNSNVQHLIPHYDRTGNKEALMADELHCYIYGNNLQAQPNQTLNPQTKKDLNETSALLQLSSGLHKTALSPHSPLCVPHRCHGQFLQCIAKAKAPVNDNSTRIIFSPFLNTALILHKLKLPEFDTLISTSCHKAML